MKLIQTSILIVFTAVLFIGNSIGIDVFKHICNTEGSISYSYIVSDDSHCAEMDEDVLITKSCCHPEEAPKEEKSGCCDNEYEHFQLDFDHFTECSSYSFSQIVDCFVVSFEGENETQTHLEKINSLRPNPPPLLKSRHRMILNQVFIV